VKNVWNQWILRVLGNEPTCWHLFASKESVEADRGYFYEYNNF